jgi:septal ring factor EnvC (AmiA/AmiB activator)
LRPVAELADSFWQTALTLAMDAAGGADSTLKNELTQLRREVETRSHALAQRELELDALVRSRERTIKELENHLRGMMSLVSKRDATIQALDARVSSALSETVGYRDRLAKMIAEADRKHPAATGASAGRRSREPSKRSRRVVRASAGKVRGKRSGQKKRPSKGMTLAPMKRI